MHEVAFLLRRNKASAACRGAVETEESIVHVGVSESEDAQILKVTTEF